MKTYTVTKTYYEITPESSENGDFSDHGFIFENQEFTLDELMAEFVLNGGVLHFIQRNGDSELLLIDQEPHMIDYSTCTRRGEDYQINASPEALKALMNELKR